MAQVCHPGQGSHLTRGSLDVPASPGARVHPGEKKGKHGKLKNPHHYETNKLNAQLCLPRTFAATPAKHQVPRKDTCQDTGKAGRGEALCTQVLQALGTWICPGSPTETAGQSQPAAIQQETQQKARKKQCIKRRSSESPLHLLLDSGAYVQSRF